jgi:hypothetical protein
MTLATLPEAEVSPLRLAKSFAPAEFGSRKLRTMAKTRNAAEPAARGFL